MDLLAENAYLRARVRELEAAVLTDPLLGLPNRRAGEEALARAQARCARGGGGYGVILLDLDHFKRVNDTPGWGGHANGDRVLQTVPVLLQHCGLRRSDLRCRWGGEEFLVLVEEGLGAAEALAQRVVAAAELELRADAEGRVPQTLSAGVASTEDARVPWAQVVAAADRALYRAKTEGRNCVRTATLETAG